MSPLLSRSALAMALAALNVSAANAGLRCTVDFDDITSASISTDQYQTGNWLAYNATFANVDRSGYYASGSSVSCGTGAGVSATGNVSPASQSQVASRQCSERASVAISRMASSGSRVSLQRPVTQAATSSESREARDDGLGNPDRDLMLKKNWWVKLGGKKDRVGVFFDTAGLATDVVLDGGPGRFYYRRPVKDQVGMTEEKEPTSEAAADEASEPAATP